jgi:hypothetical protein
MERFKYFLINEEKSYLGNRIAEILSSVQELVEDLENIGSRQTTRISQDLVNRMRNILHNNWHDKYNVHLKELQKVAVAIQKTIDERGDLKELLPAASTALGNLSGKLGMRVNNLNAPEIETGEDLRPQDFKSTGKPNFSRNKQSNPQNNSQNASEMPPDENQPMPPQQPPSVSEQPPNAPQ